jgi:hypothetical protein
MRMDGGQMMPAQKEHAMRRTGPLFIAAALAVAASMLAASTASAADAAHHRKRAANRPWHGYGFLPGYEPPEVVEWRRDFQRRPAYWYGGPQFYRGRWNGGGYGPCWTQTPIGNHWNCG